LLLDVFIKPEFDASLAVGDMRADFPNLKICLLSAYFVQIVHKPLYDPLKRELGS
jgi:hypothetical protein